RDTRSAADSPNAERRRNRHATRAAAATDRLRDQRSGIVSQRDQIACAVEFDRACAVAAAATAAQRKRCSATGGAAPDTERAAETARAAAAADRLREQGVAAIAARDNIPDSLEINVGAGPALAARSAQAD